MATIKPKSTKELVKKLGLSNYPAPNKKDANEHFLSKVKASDSDNTRNTLKVFLLIADELLQVRSFTVNEAIYKAKVYELDIPTVQDLFDKWTRAMISFCVIVEEPSCYDTRLFFVNV